MSICTTPTKMNSARQLINDIGLTADLQSDGIPNPVYGTDNKSRYFVFTDFEPSSASVPAGTYYYNRNGSPISVEPWQLRCSRAASVYDGRSGFERRDDARDATVRIVGKWQFYSPHGYHQGLGRRLVDDSGASASGVVIAADVPSGSGV